MASPSRFESPDVLQSGEQLVLVASNEEGKRVQDLRTRSQEARGGAVRGVDLLSERTPK